MKKWVIYLIAVFPAIAAGQSMLADITENVETPFGIYKPHLVTVTPDAPPCDAGKNLEHVVNLGDFTFSADELRLLKENGFVVSPAKRNDKPLGFNEMFDIYAECREQGVPQFITTDAMLHGFHLMFDRILKTCEEERFMSQLDNLLSALEEKTRTQYNAATDKMVREALFRNLDYLLVATQLLTPKHFFVDPLPGGHYAEELELIHNAEAFLVDSPIFQYPEDYTQYKPRGHYTRSEALQRYFRAMMWLGRMTFSCVQDTDYDRTMTLSAVLLTQAITQVQIDKRSGLDVWGDIYWPTVFFVGKSDDIHFHPYLSLGYDIYGKSFPIYPPGTFADNFKLTAFLQAVEALAPPLIGYPGQPKKGFRFMGQRFVPDSWILDELVYDKTPDRWMPTGLDVMIVLGPQSAAQQEWAFQYLPEGDKQNPYYTAKLDTLKRIFRSYPDETWAQNAYWNWLYCLMPLQMPAGEGYPPFMRSDAWRDKDLFAALASWAELRHDTILYVKQSGTERGMPPSAAEAQGYVEPNPHVYARLAALADFMIEGLKSRGLLFDSFHQHLNAFSELAARLTEISIKELSGRLSSEDYLTIFDFGKMLYNITTFQQEIPSEGPQALGADDLEPMPVIADVHTDANSGLVLEEGVGYPYAVYVICNIEGRPTITKGAGFSYYEFTWLATNRLTDEQWRTMLTTNTAPASPAWTDSFIGGAPGISTPAFYPWEKPGSIAMNVSLPERVEAGSSFIMTFSGNDEWSSDIPEVTLFPPVGAALPLAVEKEATGAVWRATVSTQNQTPGTAFIQIEKGTGDSKISYRTHFEITPRTEIRDEKTPPGVAQLEQNYPNPFNSQTFIQISLPKTDYVLLEVFDMNGRLVTTLANAVVPAGTYYVPWDGLDQHGGQMGSGIYYYRLKAGDFVDVKRMILLR